ncbi:MAG: hypothetical protein ABI894_08050 [Ilumatobacteraceae bacterium]
MTQPETEIRRAWRHIAGPDHDGYIDSLLVRYAEPHRRYHTATHIMFVLRHLHDVAQASAALPSAELIAAALYHDAIYDPTAGDNEALSAELATNDLTEIGWTAQRCAAAAAMVIATAGHLVDTTDSAADADSALETAMLLDADLAILGADPGAYHAYVNGVRAEYAHVDDEAWRSGRSAVLQHFLDRGPLFATHYMRDTFEHRARANIEAEMATLGHRNARID